MEGKTNIAALREYIAANRHEMLASFDRLVNSSGEEAKLLALLLIGFEAGRLFQHKNPSAALDATYLG